LITLVTEPIGTIAKTFGAPDQGSAMLLVIAEIEKPEGDLRKTHQSGRAYARKVEQGEQQPNMLQLLERSKGCHAPPIR
jgi:hypothetical protein